MFQIGPTAFDKSERGLIEPSGPTVQLITILDRHPELVKELEPDGQSAFRVLPLGGWGKVRRRAELVANQIAGPINPPDVVPGAISTQSTHFDNTPNSPKFRSLTG